MHKFLKVLNVYFLLSISSLCLAHEWRFHNITDKALVVQVKLKGVMDKFFNIVGPGQKTLFSWTGANTRAHDCLEHILIGEYNEQQVVHFPGTNSPKLPRKNGNELDASTITAEINKRGPWFNSLDRIAKKMNPPIYALDDRGWNNLNNKFNPVVVRLLNGATLQEAMSWKPFNLNDELQSASHLENPFSLPITASSLFSKSPFACESHSFLIVDLNGELVLITKK